jgi:cellulose synthase/poly-beta-1,6-N-acetylglucosamine synthase-like glycosyltransferase
MSRQRIPEDVLSAAHDRARARAERNWAEADRLRAEIAAAGWTIVDRGTDFALSPANPPTVEAEGVVRYGSSGAVPLREDREAAALASVVLIATDWPADLERAVAAIRSHGPAGSHVLVVADGPSAEQEPAIAALAADDVVFTSARLGQAAAVNIGIRQAAADVVIVLDTSVEPTGDVVTPLVQALDDPSVAIAGGWGVISDDLRKFRDAPAGDVDAVEGYAMAFRRRDARERGPLDERFRFYRNLDLWWSLVLRDEGEEQTPRRAVSVELPAIRHEHRGWASVPEAERDRLSKRNFYRIIDRFGWRRDLLIAGRD